MSAIDELGGKHADKPLVRRLSSLPHWRSSFLALDLESPVSVIALDKPSLQTGSQNCWFAIEVGRLHSNLLDGFDTEILPIVSYKNCYEKFSFVSFFLVHLTWNQTLMIISVVFSKKLSRFIFSFGSLISHQEAPLKPFPCLSNVCFK